METEMNGIGLYETMCEISGRMVQAARTNDWDQLVALEQDVAHLRDALNSCTDRSSLSVPLTPEQRKRKLQLILRILADDAEVRRHTAPWMESVKRFLGAGSRSRNVRQAYGL
jgi:flagellar protein FliT